MDSKVQAWQGPFPITADGQPVVGATANPVLLQSTWGRRGNFELFVPVGQVVKTYFRDNDDPMMPWHNSLEFGYVTRPDQAGPAVRELRVIQSNYAADGVHGNFEAIVRVALPVTQEDRLDFWFFDSLKRAWSGPFPIAHNGTLQP